VGKGRSICSPTLAANEGKEFGMSKVEQIQAAIEALSEDEYARLRKWFSERDWKKWDRQIERDAESGKLDFLVKEALEEKAKGTLRYL
jgi:hypothetical protein